MKKNRLTYLDFIRAISALGIIVFHFNCSINQHLVYTGNDDIIFSNYKNGNLGQIGVSLFIILSGASLMYSYGDDDFSVKEYLKKRWKSIFPMYYIAWICAVLFYMVRYYSLNPFCVDRKPWTILLTVFLLDGYLCDLIPNYYLLGEWFIGCILFLYILFPILRYLIIKFNKWIVLILYLCIYVLIVQVYKLDFNIECFVFTRLLEFLFGMVIMSCLAKMNVYCKIKMNLYKSFGLCLNKKIRILFLVSVFLCLGITVMLCSVYINIPQMYKTTLMGICIFIILLFIGLFIGDRGGNIFSYISKLSYAIFLCHHIVIDQICTHFDNRNYGKLETYVILAITIIVIICIAHLLYSLHNKLVGIVRKSLKRKEEVSVK